MSVSELQKDSVERTLCIPLWCRAIAVKKLPQILPDHDAVRILREMGETKPPTIFYNMECAALAGAIRQYDLACAINEYLTIHPQATVVEMGAGLSCLRRQMKNDSNPWVNIDLPDVIACREKYIPTGEHEINMSCDLTDHSWFQKIPFDADKGIIFVAAGVLHYFTHEAVKSLIRDMAESFPGGCFAFDYISEKNLKDAGSKVKDTDNGTQILFYMNDAEKEIPVWSDRLAEVRQLSYLEGYPVEGVRYNPITRLYIRSKRDKLYVAHVEFK